MVGGEGETLEPIQSETIISLPNDSDRCFKIGLGSSLSPVSDRWAVNRESQFDINYLKLLAAFLAFQSFAKREKHLTVYLYMDNVSAMTYINKKGGVHSRSLTPLAKECWG